jgi:hypothetical protein
MGTTKDAPASRRTAKAFAKLEKERDVLTAIVEIAGALIVVLGRFADHHFNRAYEKTAYYSSVECR